MQSCYPHTLHVKATESFWLSFFREIIVQNKKTTTNVINNTKTIVHIPLTLPFLIRFLDDSGSAAFGLTLSEILNGIPYIRIFKNKTVF